MPPEPEVEPDETDGADGSEAADLPFEVVGEPELDEEPAGTDRDLAEVINEPEFDDPA